MAEIKRNQYERFDGYNPSVKVDDHIQERWIHKDVVKKTGDGEDDFIIEQKPVKIDEVDIFKQIQEEAKTTDLKYLLKQLMMTGDESVLNRREGFYGDVSMFENDHSLNKSKIDLEALKSTLPEEFKSMSNEDLAKLTNEEILKYFEDYRKKLTEEKDVPPVVEEIKKEGEE